MKLLRTTAILLLLWLPTLPTLPAAAQGVELEDIGDGYYRAEFQGFRTSRGERYHLELHYRCNHRFADPTTRGRRYRACPREGMQACQKIIGLVRGLKTGLGNFRKSVVDMISTEKRDPVGTLSISVPKSSVEYGKAYRFAIADLYGMDG